MQVGAPSVTTAVMTWWSVVGSVALVGVTVRHCADVVLTQVFVTSAARFSPVSGVPLLLVSIQVAIVSVPAVWLV